MKLSYNIVKIELTQNYVLQRWQKHHKDVIHQGGTDEAFLGYLIPLVGAWLKENVKDEQCILPKNLKRKFTCFLFKEGNYAPSEKMILKFRFKNKMDAVRFKLACK